jgi:hypothetical protein
MGSRLICPTQCPAALHERLDIAVLTPQIVSADKTGLRKDALRGLVEALGLFSFPRSSFSR